MPKLFSPFSKEPTEVESALQSSRLIFDGPLVFDGCELGEPDSEVLHQGGGEMFTCHGLLEFLETHVGEFIQPETPEQANFLLHFDLITHILQFLLPRSIHATPQVPCVDDRSQNFASDAFTESAHTLCLFGPRPENFGCHVVVQQHVCILALFYELDGRVMLQCFY